MSEHGVSVSAHEEGVQVLCLDRPPVNALTPAVLSELEKVLSELDADPEVRTVVVCGSGAVLSGGMDLKALQQFSPAEQRAMVDGLNRSFACLYRLSKPVVCAAHGAAIAGGAFFVLASDYRIAGERARIGLAEMRVGVRFPVGPFAIARAELTAPACRLFMLGGEAHDAQTALRLGVVDEVVATDEVFERALAVASRYAKLPPRTFAHTKRALRAETLARIDAAIASGDPLADGWFDDETMASTRAMLASLKAAS